MHSTKAERRVVEEVLRRLESESAALSDAFARDLHATHPFYRLLDDEEMVSRTRETYHVGLAAFVRWAGDGGHADRLTLPPDDVAYYRRQAVDAAVQLVPLEALKQPIRIGEQALWNWIVDACGRRPEGLRAALFLLERLNHFVNALDGLLSETYLETRFDFHEQEQVFSREVLESLLAGRHLDRRAAVRLAAAFGLEDEVDCVVLVAAPNDPADRSAREAVHAVMDVLPETVLADRRLIADHGEEIVGVLPLRGRNEQVDDIVSRWATFRTGTRRSAGVDLRVGISTPGRLVDVPERYDEARLAMSFAASHPRGVVAMTDVRLFDYLVTKVDGTATRIVPAHVAVLQREDARANGALVSTLWALAAADLNVGRAAAALSVHANTVHYRLRRIAELTGTNPRSFWTLVEMLIATRCGTPQATSVDTGSAARRGTDPAGSPA